MQKEDIGMTKGELEYSRTPFNIEDIPCGTHVVVNYLTLGEDLVRFAADNSIDGIFIGIKKRSKVGKLAFGYTAQYVIMEAPCQVVAVK
jgi:nucleotide-binding universal stress UspA family protein